MRRSGVGRGVARRVVAVSLGVLLAATVTVADRIPAGAAASPFAETVNGPLGFFPVTTPPVVNDLDGDWLYASENKMVRIFPCATCGAATTPALDVDVPAGVSAVVLSVQVGHVGLDNGGIRFGGPTPGGARDVATKTAKPSTATVVAQLYDTSAGDRVVYLNNLSSLDDLVVTAHVVGFYAVEQLIGGDFYHWRYRAVGSSTVLDQRTEGTPPVGATFEWDENGELPGGEAANSSGTGDQLTIETNTAGPPAGAARVHVQLGLTPIASDPPPPNTPPVWCRVYMKGSPGNYNSDQAFRFNALTLNSKRTDVPIGADGLVHIWWDPNDAGPLCETKVTLTVLGWTDASGVFYAPQSPATPVAGGLPVDDSRSTGIERAISAGDTSLLLDNLDGFVQSPTADDPTVAMLGISLSGSNQSGTLSAGGVPVLRFTAGDTVSNLAYVPFESNGTVKLTLSPAGTTATVRIDGQGYWRREQYPDVGGVAPSTERFQTLPKVRLLAGTSTQPDSTLEVDVNLAAADPPNPPGVSGVPETGVGSVLLLVGVRNPSAATALKVWGKGRPEPTISQITTSSVRPAASLVLADPDENGKVLLQLEGGAANLDVSVLGFTTPYTGDGDATSNIAIFGDSITYATSKEFQDEVGLDNDDEPEFDGPDTAQRANVLGLPGQMSFQLRWWAFDMARSNPQGVIINLGSNDAVVGGKPINKVADWVALHISQMMIPFDSVPCRWAVTINTNRVPGGPVQLRILEINARLRELEQNETLDGLPEDSVGLIDWDQFVTDIAAYPSQYLVLEENNHFWLHPTPAGQTELAHLYDVALKGTESIYYDVHPQMPNPDPEHPDPFIPGPFPYQDYIIAHPAEPGRWVDGTC